MRGEFIRADGLVVPNNITKHGVELILRSALRDESPTLYVGLANAVPDFNLEADDLNEPTIGTNGYARINVPRSSVGWPGEGYVNAEYYVETAFLTWVATGAGFNRPINRLALMRHPTQVVGSIVAALSVSLPAPITILPTTPLAERQFKYRIYGR